MSFIRRDPAFLDEIVRSADQIAAICARLNPEGLAKSEVSQAALLHHLTVIGEAAGRISTDLKARHPEIPWSRIVSQRNRIVHDYFGLDWTLLWKTMLLEAEFPEEPPVES